MISASVKYIETWNDPNPLIRQIRDDAMLPISKGIYYHHRLQLLIVVKGELDNIHVVTHLPGN